MGTITSPSISVVMPVWNGEMYLREAVDGIIAQTFNDFELIVVDDGSTDRSVEILESYKDTRIRIIKQEKKGFVAAVNRGVAEARAEWIARHDADDISHPLRLQTQWELAQDNPGAVLVSCQVKFFGDNLLTVFGPRRAKTQAFIALRSCYLCPVSVGAALIKREAFLAAEGYREQEFPAEDYAFSSRLFELGPFVGSPETLYHIRWHNAQISVVRRQAQFEQSRRIELQNCTRFFRLNRHHIQEVHAILSGAENYRSLWHSLRLVGYLMFFRPQSLEIWAWVVYKRLIGDMIASIKHDRS